MSFKSLLESAGVLVVGDKSDFAKVYLPYGWSIRERLYGLARQTLTEALGYAEFSLPHIVGRRSLNTLDTIYPFSKNFISLRGDSAVAASHEATFYTFMRRYLQLNGATLPFRGYTFGPVFRHSKSIPFPFSGGERASFLESYGVFRTRTEALEDMDKSIIWTRSLITDRLAIPSVCVRRPLATNKPVSHRTVCVDSVTPLGRTAITGMSYFHDDIFTSAFGVRWRDETGRRRLAYSVHFGVSDNLLFAYLINSCDDRGLRLLADIAPIHVRIYNPHLHPDGSILSRAITDSLTTAGIRVEQSDTTMSQLGAAIRRSKTAGIPVQLVVYPHESNAGEVLTITRDSDQQSRWPLNAILQNVLFTLGELDQQIRRASQQRYSDNVILCSTLREVNAALQAGLVACTPLHSHNSSVRKLEQTLTSGEVLGFADGYAGIDVLTGRPAQTLAYVSRRT